jgi:T5SS/PEP-CTERM-associated repeat protein
MRIGTVSGQTGTLAIGAGGSVTNGRTAVGSGGTGAATVSGAGAKWTLTDHFFVGGSRSGSLLIEGGGSVDVNSVLFVGNSSGFSGAVTVNGSGSSLAALQVLIGSGLGGTGVLNIEEGATLTYAGATGGVELAGRDFSSGTLNIGTGGAAGTLNARSVSAAFGLGSIATVNFNHTGATTFAPELQGILSVN